MLVITILRLHGREEHGVLFHRRASHDPVQSILRLCRWLHQRIRHQVLAILAAGVGVAA